MGADETSIVFNYDANRQALSKEVYNNGKLQSRNVDTLKEINILNYSEDDWKQIQQKGFQEIDFCILDNNFTGVAECISLFRKNDADYTVPALDKYRVTKKGSKCYSYIARPGSVFAYSDRNKLDKLFGKDVIVEGNKCLIEYTDYNYDDNDYKRCCFTKNKEKCNKNLINDYETPHCNNIMSEMCEDDPDNINCIRWLEQSNSNSRNDVVALKLYNNICSTNMKRKSCEYFEKTSRIKNNYLSEFYDSALNKWCDNNQSECECLCLLNKVPVADVETYLGPKECWLKECSSQINRWLTTDQIKTRQNCQLTACTISIKNLILNDDASAEFINDCVSGIKVSATAKENITIDDIILDINKSYTPGICFSVSLLLISLLFLLILKS